jgi:uncharacterized protein YqeY
MTLKEQLQTDTATAMREGDTKKRDTLRMMLAAVKQIEVDEQISLDEEGVKSVLTKQAKQRRESIADAEKAGRTELIAQERGMPIRRWWPAIPRALRSWSACAWTTPSLLVCWSA